MTEETGPDPLDDRIMALTEGLPEEQQQAIRAPLAYVREAWRGADYYPDIDRALEVIEENTAEIRRQLAELGVAGRDGAQQ